MTRLFKTTVKAKGMNEPFVDWYEGENQTVALAEFDNDLIKYGLPPKDQLDIQIVECDPETLKPL